MASYKVAQDVEADDHLLGPFTVRQFIYLIIVAMAGGIAYFLSRLALPLIVLPLPIILFFGILALPLRKDQPMEVYFAALLSYYLKPRKRFWIPDGQTSLIEITAPLAAEEQLTKNFTGSEAETRLSYLASIVDTEGWAVRHAIANSNQSNNTSMISDVYNDAQATQDPLDAGGTVAQSFESMLNEATEKRRQEIMDHMRNPNDFAVPAQPAPAATIPTQAPYTNPYTTFTQPAPQQAAAQIPSDMHFNPYPNIHQSVVQPLGSDDQIATTAPAMSPAYTQPPEPVIQQQPYATPTPAPQSDQTTKSTSETPMSPDIIKLVNNSDLSIETIAREAHRIQGKDDGDEVIISLR